MWPSRLLLGANDPLFLPSSPPSPSFHQFLMLFNNNDQNMPNSGTVQYCILFTLGIFLHQSWNISGQIVGSTSPFQNQNIHGSPQFRLFVKCATPIKGVETTCGALWLSLIIPTPHPRSSYTFQSAVLFIDYSGLDWLLLSKLPQHFI